MLRLVIAVVFSTSAASADEWKWPATYPANTELTNARHAFAFRVPTGWRVIRDERIDRIVMTSDAMKEAQLVVEFENDHPFEKYVEWGPEIDDWQTDEWKGPTSSKFQVAKGEATATIRGRFKNRPVVGLVALRSIDMFTIAVTGAAPAASEPGLRAAFTKLRASVRPMTDDEIRRNGVTYRDLVIGKRIDVDVFFDGKPRGSRAVQFCANGTFIEETDDKLRGNPAREKRGTWHIRGSGAVFMFGAHRESTRFVTTRPTPTSPERASLWGSYFTVNGPARCP